MTEVFPPNATRSLYEEKAAIRAELLKRSKVLFQRTTKFCAQQLGRVTNDAGEASVGSVQPEHTFKIFLVNVRDSMPVPWQHQLVFRAAPQARPQYQREPRSRSRSSGAFRKLSGQSR